MNQRCPILYDFVVLANTFRAQLNLNTSFRSTATNWFLKFLKQPNNAYANGLKFSKVHQRKPGAWIIQLVETYSPVGDLPPSRFPTGWWLTYLYEKYEFVSWDNEIPNLMKRIKNDPNHQSDYLIHLQLGFAIVIQDFLKMNSQLSAVALVFLCLLPSGKLT